jgi:hypothetical protein
MNLWFGSAVILLLTVGIVRGLFSGEALIVALWSSINQARPVEWMMFFAFWYAAVSSPNLDFWWNRKVTSLALTEHK